MLSPRKFAAGKKFLQRWQNAKKRQAKRGFRIESLEKRELMAFDLAAYLPESTVYGPAEYAPSDIDRLSALASGEANPIVTTEVEPNNLPRTAMAVNVGTLPSQSSIATISGRLNTVNNIVLDEDYYVVNLRAGDVFQAALTSGGTLPSVSVMDANQSELMGTNSPASLQYVPTNSPMFPGNVSSAVTLVIPATGTYYVRVGDAAGVYSLRMRAMRNSIESQPIGTKQIVYLDFNGAILNGNIYSDSGVSGTTRLPSMIDTLQDFGFQASEENELIDKIVAVVKENFNGSLPTIGANGYYRVDGRPGAFDIEILNSRDHEDPWGLPNVSRIILGGTAADFTSTVGLAQSIDIGNFLREETGVVLAGEFFTAPDADVRLVPRAASKTLVDVYAVAAGNVISHELGHMFGAAHQDNSNANITLMDSGAIPFSNTLVGVGLDGIYGTPDDVDLDFGRDAWSRNPAGENTFTGRYNHAINFSFALATGTVGSTISGVLYNDVNRNGRQDSGDAGLSGWEVYADLNNNGIREVGEPKGTSDAAGNYSIAVGAGTYTIRVTRPASWIAATSADAAKTVTVSTAGAVANFGSVVPSNVVTGYKWLDINGDGVRDAGEPGLAGVYIYLDLDGDDRPDVGEPATTTAADGSYRLTPPSAGTYTIREVVDAGYRATFPASGEHIVVYDGVTPLGGYDFGNTESSDWGDAPAPYPTTRASNGASHGQLAGLRLGTLWDAEQDGQPSNNATGDDNNGLDDEDGVIQLTPLVIGDGSNIIQVTVTNTTGSAAYISGWMDFNGDGDWSDAGEQIATNIIATTSGVYNITFNIPSTVNGAAVAAGNKFARFRLSQTQNLAPTGRAAAGEVEDYAFPVVAGPRTLLQPDSFTVSRNSTQNLLSVLANDFTIPGETWSIVGVTSGARGGRVTIESSLTRVNYVPPLNFIGTDEFTYTARSNTGRTETARVSIIINAQFTDPVAVDDSFDVPVNSIGFPLNVLANDIEGMGGALIVTSVSTPSQGGSVTIGSGGQSIRYTPQRNFGGTETLTYTATDATGKSTTASITIHTIPGARSDDLVEFSFGFFNLAGEAITEIRQGEQFRVGVFVQDLRPSIGRAQVPPVFVTDPGVYAAYLDILYSSGLITPAAPSTTGSALDFEVTFNSPYLEGRDGTAAVPGIINEFGAFAGQAALNLQNRVQVGSILFTATNPGLAEFIGDPADLTPQNDVVFYNTTRSAIPDANIRYGRSTIEVVPTGVNFPYAKDDSPARLPSGTSSIIDVLANDISGTQPPIRLTSVTQPVNGQVEISNNGTPNNFADDRVIYTPNTNFTGTDSFQYTITDQRGFTSTATVTVQVGTQNQVQSDDLVELRLSVTDLQGNEISQITTGEKFQLRGFVKDLRTNPTAGGVFAAFQDILYSSGLVSVDGRTTTPFFNVEYSTTYSDATAGDVRIPGLINEIGSAQAVTGPLGVEERLQFTVTFTANNPGTATFVGDPADIKPFHDSLLFNPTDPLTPAQVRYTSDSLVIVGSALGGGSGEGFTNLNNALDVNNDGSVSPIDVLILVNALNSGGAGKLSGRTSDGASGEGGLWYYIDVDADTFLTPLDALSVINFLNHRSGFGSGEGEAALVAEGESNLSVPFAAARSTSLESVELPLDPGGSVSSDVAGYFTSFASQDNDKDEDPIDLTDYVSSNGDSDDELIDGVLASMFG